MRRLPVFTLCTLGLLGLSCQITWHAPNSQARSVATAEPSEERPAVAEDPAADVEQPGLAQEQVILAELHRRHTGLADHEIIELARTIVAESRRHDFDPALVMAVIHVESSGYHLAVSHVGAIGLMQLMPATAEELAGKLDIPWQGPDSLFDPLLNVKLGVAYLRQLTDRYDNMPTALAAYNWGPGRIDRRIRRGATVPVRYIEQVMRAYDVDRAAGRS